MFANLRAARRPAAELPFTLRLPRIAEEREAHRNGDGDQVLLGGQQTLMAAQHQDERNYKRPFLLGPGTRVN